MGFAQLIVLATTCKCGRGNIFGLVCVCMPVCLFVCPVLDITFESLDLETSFLVCGVHLQHI